MGSTFDLKPLKLLALPVLLAGCACTDVVFETPTPEKTMAMPAKTKKVVPDAMDTLELRGGDLYVSRRGGAAAAVPGEARFKFDSYSMPEGFKAALRKHARFLSQNPRRNVVIEGHCDERGTREYNLALGELRARAVSRYLKAQGVSGAQIQTISFGEEKPVDPASGERAWAKNRRALIVYKRR